MRTANGRGVLYIVDNARIADKAPFATGLNLIANEIYTYYIRIRLDHNVCGRKDHVATPHRGAHMFENVSSCPRLGSPATGFILGICLLSLLPHARAQDAGPGVATDPKPIADSFLQHSMELNTEAHQALSLVKAIITTDPFALVTVLAELLGPGGKKADISILQARDEILAEIRQVREEELVARSNSLLSRFQELVDDPHNMVANDRLANYLDDASDLFSDLQLIMRNGDYSRARSVYHLAPTYNTVTSSRIVGLATAGWSLDSILRVYGEAIKTNTDLVQSKSNAATLAGDYDGYLYTYVVSLPWRERPWTCPTGGDTGMIACSVSDITCCNPITLRCPNFVGGRPSSDECHDDVLAEARARFDSDPIIYSIRRSRNEQTWAALY